MSLILGALDANFFSTPDDCLVERFRHLGIGCLGRSLSIGLLSVEPDAHFIEPRINELASNSGFLRKPAVLRRARSRRDLDHDLIGR